MAEKTLETTTFPSAQEMMDAALAAAAGGAVVLTPTSRLAKRYRHVWRMLAIRTGAETSWETPEVMGLARWLRANYESLWEPKAVLPKAGQLHYWAQASTAVPLPEEFAAGILPGPALYAKLQQTYDLLCRKRAERSGPDEGLGAWRLAVIREFEKAVEKGGYRCWGQVVQTVARAFGDGRIPSPARVVLILRDDPEPLDEILMEGLRSGGAEVTVWHLTGTVERSACRVFATPEQESRAVCHELRLAWNGCAGSKYLGVVPLDEAYFPHLQRGLEELSARMATGKGEARFNLAWGTSLPAHPFFQVGTIPLRLATAEAPAALLAGLLASPLCNPREHKVSPAAIRSTLWPEDRALDAAGAVRALVAAGDEFKALSRALKPFTQTAPRPLREWAERLRAVWGLLGFGYRGEGVSEAVRDAQANAWDGLNGSLLELERLAGTEATGSAEAFEWLRVTAENRRVVAPGAESGGIQVLGLNEAFGIPFDRVWFVGCHGGVLPSGIPAQPLLTPDEARAFDGPPAERAWERAERSLSMMAALSAEPGAAFFSRPMAKPGGDPYLPSPLLLDEAGPGGGVFDIWGDHAGDWGAAPWLAGTLEGLSTEAQAQPPRTEEVPGAVPQEISATSFGTYLQCPFKFFAERLLQIKAVPDSPLGIPPQERGCVVHKIAALFMMAMPEAAPGWPGEDSLEGAWRVLQQTAEDVLNERPHSPEWAAERRWLLGEGPGGELGLLRSWLEVEQQHAQAGWRPIRHAIEAKFVGLRLEGGAPPLVGKVDRVDEHPSGGRMVIDYKTGRPPGPDTVFKHWLDPQLLAYGLAVARDLIRPEGERKPFDGPIQGCYLKLGRRDGVAIENFRHKRQNAKTYSRDQVLAWEKEVAPRLLALSGGHFPVEPRPKLQATTRSSRPCIFCAYPTLCGFFDDPERALAEGDEGEEE